MATYTGNSIVDYLTSIGQNSSYNNRAALAKQMGISNYSGNASQNLQLLNLLRTQEANTKPSTKTPSSNNTQQNDNQQMSTSGSAYPLGDYSLVRFKDLGPAGYMSDQQIFLLDNTNRSLRPFQNMAALQNFFDGEVDPDKIVVRPATDLAPGGPLGSNAGKPGYQLLGSEYAIQSNGTARKLDYSISQLSERYGAPVNEETEHTMYMSLKGALKMFEDDGIDSNQIAKIKKDKELMAFYISAMTYGGYSLGDIYSDIKKRELGINNLAPISATASKTEYAKTSDYQKASIDSRIMPPKEIGGMNATQLALPVYNLPDEAFKTLIPILDYDSEEFKKAMEAVETSYYDVLEKQLQASTEQEKAIADYEYQKWKEEVSRTYGIQLSNNALEAWNQIQQAFNSGSERGIMNSGIQNESIDQYLRSVRRTDSETRTQKLTQEEEKKRQYYLTAASASEIKALVDSDPETAKKYGLVPSEDIKNSLSVSALKQKFPNADEEFLAQYVATILDENGNYRSQLYQKQMGSIQDLVGGNTNTLGGIKTAKTEFTRDEALRKSLLAEEDAYKEFTTPDVAFLRANDSNNNKVENITGLKKPKTTENLSSILHKAASNLKSPTTPTTPTAPKTTPSSEMSQSQIDSMMSQVKKLQSQVSAAAASKGITLPKTSTSSSTPSAPKVNTSVSSNNNKVNTNSSNSTKRALRSYTTADGFRVTKFSDGTETRVKK